MEPVQGCAETPEHCFVIIGLHFVSLVETGFISLIIISALTVVFLPALVGRKTRLFTYQQTCGVLILLTVVQNVLYTHIVQIMMGPLLT